MSPDGLAELLLKTRFGIECDVVLHLNASEKTGTKVGEMAALNHLRWDEGGVFKELGKR